jgi:cysteine sulfinate desulfinase/cysteine desulfurase-like protein
MEPVADDGFIYLDNNATTPLDPAVIEEMLPFLTKYYGNPSSGYGFAAKARKAVDVARQQLAALLGCEPPEIVFTSGGTESNNAVIASALAYSAVAAAKAGSTSCEICGSFFFAEALGSAHASSRRFQQGLRK